MPIKILLIIIATIQIFACFPNTDKITIVFNKSNVELDKGEIKKLALKYDVAVDLFKVSNIQYIVFYKHKEDNIIEYPEVYKEINSSIKQMPYKSNRDKVIKILNLSYKNGFIKNLNKKDLNQIEENLGDGLILFYLPKGCKVNKRFYNSLIYNGKYLYVKDSKQIKQKDIEEKWYGFTNDTPPSFFNIKKCPVRIEPIRKY